MDGEDPGRAGGISGGAVGGAEEGAVGELGEEIEDVEGGAEGVVEVRGAVPGGGVEGLAFGIVGCWGWGWEIA